MVENQSGERLMIQSKAAKATAGPGRGARRPRAGARTVSWMSPVASCRVDQLHRRWDRKMSEREVDDGAGDEEAGLR
jgi:hypothetical protein